jgi:hypothetical protein
VVYLSYHDFSGPNIWVLRSSDYGQTFTQAVPVTVFASNFVDTSQANTTARMLIDPIDPRIITMLYASNTAAKSATAPPTNQDFDLNQIYMARSTDSGKTWANTKLYDAGQTAGEDNTIAHEFPSTAIDSTGNLYIVFSERLGGHTETHLRLGVIRRGATKMSNPVQVDSGTGANVFPWVTAGETGRIDVTWYGSLAKDNNDTKSAWAEMFAQSTNALDAQPAFVQSRISGQEPIHSADICLAGTLCLVTGGNRNLADFQGVDVDPCGYAEVVWTDDHTGVGYTVFGRQAGGTTLRPHACITPTGRRSVAAPKRGLAPTGPSTWTTPIALTVAAGLVAGAAVLRRRLRH